MSDLFDHEDPPEPDPELVARLTAAADVLEDELRRIGVYVTRTAVVDPAHIANPALLDGDKPILFLEAILGNVAFTTRVQDPIQHEFDREFRKMEHGQVYDDFLNTRAELERRLQEGKPVLGDTEAE